MNGLTVMSDITQATTAEGSAFTILALVNCRFLTCTPSVNLHTYHVALDSQPLQTDMELFAVSAADFMIQVGTQSVPRFQEAFVKVYTPQALLCMTAAQEAESISRDLDERLRWSLYRETVACQVSRAPA
mmetsp:Transcript_31077/g.99718  ORF Transcript_31077/g.99718 Transcript_31077/m.99718 type:complete len:130 (+) Transcript_31077:396-785(+)